MTTNATQFKTGDIVGCKFFDLPGIIVQLGEFLAHPRLGFEYQYTHVGLLYVKDNDLFVAEAVGGGLQLNPLSKYDRSRYTIGTISTLTTEDSQKIKDFVDYSLEQHIEYNWFQVTWLAVAKLLRLEWIKNPFSGSKRSTICSAFVQDALEPVGIKFKDNASENVDPLEIMTDKRVTLYHQHNC